MLKKKPRQKHKLIKYFDPIYDPNGHQQATQQQSKAATTNATFDNFGRLPMIQSKDRPGRVFTRVEDLDDSKANQTVLVRVRVHTSRPTGI